MSSGLLYCTTNTKPKIGQVLNINTDYEPLKRGVETINSKTIFKNLYEATDNLPERTDCIGAVCFLADDIKQTAKMKNILERIRYFDNEIITLQKEWKERSLNVNQKKCYNCGSKIVQNHNQTKISRNTHCCCPNCNASDYILTQGSRNKIQKMKDKIQDYKIQYFELEEKAFEKELKKKKPNLQWVVGGWIHESELPQDY